MQVTSIRSTIRTSDCMIISEPTAEKSTIILYSKDRRARDPRTQHKLTVLSHEAHRLEDVFRYAVETSQKEEFFAFIDDGTGRRQGRYNGGLNINGDPVKSKAFEDFEAKATKFWTDHKDTGRIFASKRKIGEVLGGGELARPLSPTLGETRKNVGPVVGRALARGGGEGDEETGIIVGRALAGGGVTEEDVVNTLGARSKYLKPVNTFFALSKDDQVKSMSLLIKNRDKRDLSESDISRRTIELENSRTREGLSRDWRRKLIY